ncbi:MAG: hypothetical protein QM594_03245, partial [Niabella sp.]
MKKQFSLAAFPYIPKLWATSVYFILLIVVFLLFMGRTNETLRFQPLLHLFPDFYSHVSNFSISFMVCLVSGYMGIMGTRKMKPTIFIGVLLMVANFIYEWFVSFLNIPDKTDAYYGFAGTFLPFIFFVFYRKWGLMKNPKFEKSKQ